jgi:hypothetical protein
VPDRSSPRGRRIASATFILSLAVIVSLGAPRTLRAFSLPATAIVLKALPSTWSRGIAVVHLHRGGGDELAVLDTGGYTESKAKHPRNFSTYYRGLPVSQSLGPDYLLDHVVTIGGTHGPTETSLLEIRTWRGGAFAFVSCKIGDEQYRLLFDTAAFAWPLSDASHASPQAAIFVRPQVFSKIQNGGPSKGAYEIVDSRGAFVHARTIRAAVRCGGSTRMKRLLVERVDPSTYEWFSKALAINVVGDASLDAFSGAGIRIDFPRRTLTVWPDDRI